MFLVYGTFIHLLKTYIFSSLFYLKIYTVDKGFSTSRMGLRGLQGKVTNKNKKNSGHRYHTSGG